MVGVISFLAAHINAAAIMVVGIYLSTFLYGRFFCGWLCHLRGLIEFSDWVMQKLGVKNYNKIRDKNVLLNTRYRWYFRVLTLLILLAPIFTFYAKGNFHINLNPETMPPLTDLPGSDGKLFNESFPINMNIGWAVGDFFIALSCTLFILLSISFLMNYHFGQGAFCRILCPYAVPFVPLLNVSPWQKKITRVDDCKGCRKCSENCPQGIDVSREIHHFAGKVINRECIKCYRCIDSCVTDVLVDTRKQAVAQIMERKAHKEYKLHPWPNGQRHLQIFQPLPIWIEVLTIFVAIIIGTISSMLGGFWFYVGAIFSFVFTRKAYMVGKETDYSISTQSEVIDLEVFLSGSKQDTIFKLNKRKDQMRRKLLKEEESYKDLSEQVGLDNRNRYE